MTRYPLPATRIAPRDPDGWLRVLIPAQLASGAHQTGEETEFIVYLVARALDTRGEGRVETLGVARELRQAISGKQLNRAIAGEKGRRYWEVEGPWLRLRAQVRILESFECELVNSDLGREFPVSVLDNRKRRGAALFSAIVAGHDAPRTNEFIHTVAKIDRKTLAGWVADPVIRRHILRKEPQWASRATILA